MNGWWVVIFMGSTPIGGPIAGWVAQHYSPAAALAVGGAATAIAAAWAYTQQTQRSPVIAVASDKQLD
jgi:predicted MFS family arabinose efflux permease